MKKILTFFLILMTVFSFLYAANDNDTLTVLAYKKKKNTEAREFSMQIIDALTEDLKTIKSGDEINMTDYVNKYVDTIKGNNYTYSDLELGKKAIFSIHASGNEKGTFTCSIKIGEFARELEDKNEDGTTKYSTTDVISVNYYLREIQTVFSDTETTTKGDKTINQLTGELNLNDVIKSSAGSGEQELFFKWTVSDDTTTKDYWDVRAMVAMIFDVDIYDGKNSNTGEDLVPNGEYRAFITVTITV